MPRIACQGLAWIHETSRRQLSTRPESTPSVAEKRYSTEPESRSQYTSANVGNIFQVSSAPAPVARASTKATRERGTRLRLCQTSTAQATATLRRDDRE